MGEVGLLSSMLEQRSDQHGTKVTLLVKSFGIISMLCQDRPGNTLHQACRRQFKARVNWRGQWKSTAAILSS